MAQGEQGHNDEREGVFSMVFHPGGIADPGSSRRPPTRESVYQEEAAEVRESQGAEPGFGLGPDRSSATMHVSLNGHDLGQIPISNRKPERTPRAESTAPQDSRALAIQDAEEVQPANGLDAIGIAGDNLPGPGTDVVRYEEPPTPPTRTDLILRGKFLPAANLPYQGTTPIKPMELVPVAKDAAVEIVRRHLPGPIAEDPILGVGIEQFAKDMATATYVRAIKDDHEKPGPIKGALDKRMPDRAIALENQRVTEIAQNAGSIAAADTVMLRPPEETTREAFGILGATRFTLDFDGQVVVDMQEVAPLLERHTPDRLRTQSSRERDEANGITIPDESRAIDARYDDLRMVRRDNNSMGPTYGVAVVLHNPESPDRYYAAAVRPTHTQAPGSSETSVLGVAGAVEIDVHTAFALTNRLAAAAISASEQVRQPGKTEATEHTSTVITVGDTVAANAWLTNQRAIGEDVGIRPRRRGVSPVAQPIGLPDDSDVVEAELEE